MKESFYNVYVFYDGKHYYLNTVSRTIIELDEYNKNLIDNHLFDKLDSSVMSYLKEQRFFVYESENELKQIKDDVIKKYNESLFITILPTKLCNFKCRYCYEVNDNKNLNLIDYQLIIKKIKTFKNLKYLHISWFGGEPTLKYEDMINFMKKINDQLSGCTKIIYSITTNFYLMDRVKFLELHRLGLKTFQVTIDGLEDTHNYFRPLKNGEKTFDVIINNLCSLQSLEEEFDIIIRLNYSCNESYLAYLEYMGEIFGKDDRFKFLFNPIFDSEKNKDKSYITFDDDLIKIKCQELKKIALKNNLTLYENDILDKFEGCYASKPNSFVVNSNKDICKCTVKLSEFNENIISNLEDFELNKCKSVRFHPVCETCVLFPVCNGTVCNFEEVNYEKCMSLKFQELKKVVINMHYRL